MTYFDLVNLPASLSLDGKTIPLSAGRNAVCGTLTAEVLTERQGEHWAYRSLVLSNPGTENSPQIRCPLTLDTAIPCGETVQFYTLHGDDYSKNSFLPIARELKNGDTVTLIPTGGRSSNTSAFPIFDVTFGGKTLLVAIGWSGQWKCEIAVEDNRLCIRAGLEYADFYVKPGETLALPRVLTAEADTPTAARRLLRNLLLHEFNPIPASYPTDHLPISIQPFDRYFWERCYGWPTEDGQLRTLENALKCEYFDTLWLDAAWFKKGFPCGVGNYCFEDGFPRGLKPVTDAAHAAGMRFVLWFEPERISKDSEVYTEHPDYCIGSTDNKAEELVWLYDLGNDEAWAWLLDTLTRVIRDNGVDNFRQDFNMDPLPFWLQNDEENRRGITEIRYINGFYRLWDALKKEFPDLLIDDCASGGRRIDFETMRRAVPMWRSDITCQPITEERHNDVYNQNETLTLAEYLPYHACAVWEPVPSDVRSAATAGLSCAFDILNPDFDYDRARAVLAEVSDLASLWKGDFYPLTAATLDENVFAAYQLALPEEGFAAVYRRAQCPDAQTTLRLQGLEADAQYHVTCTDEDMQKESCVLTGAELTAGLTVTLPRAHTSMIVRYRKA